jgi:hypothetical protein
VFVCACNGARPLYLEPNMGCCEDSISERVGDVQLNQSVKVSVNVTDVISFLAGPLGFEPRTFSLEG